MLSQDLISRLCVPEPRLKERRFLLVCRVRHNSPHLCLDKKVLRKLKQYDQQLAGLRARGVLSRYKPGKCGTPGCENPKHRTRNNDLIAYCSECNRRRWREYDARRKHQERANGVAEHAIGY